MMSIDSQHKRRAAMQILIRVLFSFVLLVLSFTAAAEATNVADPDIACALLSDDRLRAGDWYKRSGSEVYECRSHYREFLTDGPLNHRIRYLARGNKTTVNLLLLELQVRARKDVQRAQKHLLEYATTLIKKTLAVDVPGDMEDAILSGIEGSWKLGGVVVNLLRVRSRGMSYELRLEIQY
jgi:hypothetical protein